MGFVTQYCVYGFEEKNTKLLFLPFNANTVRVRGKGQPGSFAVSAAI